MQSTRRPRCVIGAAAAAAAAIKISTPCVAVAVWHPATEDVILPYHDLVKITTLVVVIFSTP